MVMVRGRGRVTARVRVRVRGRGRGGTCLAAGRQLAQTSGWYRSA